MQVVAQVAIRVEQAARCFVDDELLTHAAPLGSLVVGTRQVGYGHALASVLCPNPVAVGQVNADGAGRIEVSAQHRGTNHLGAHAAALLLAEAGVDGRVVLEPLGVVAQRLGTLGSLVVDDVDVAFPTGLQPERVAIDLDEAVGKVHLALGLLYPKDAVFVERLQVACAIERDERVDDGLLPLVLGVGPGLKERVTDVVDSLAVESAAAPYVLAESAVGGSFQSAVHAQHGRTARVGLLLQVGIEGLGFGLRDVFGVIVARGGEQEVLAVGSIHAPRHHFGTEDDVGQPLGKLPRRLVRTERKQGDIELPDFAKEERAAELRHELQAAVVMVNAAGEPDTLHVDRKGLPVGTILRAVVVHIDCLQRLPKLKSTRTVLLPQDVAPPQSGLGQIENQKLLPEGQALKARHPVAKQLQVRKALLQHRGRVSLGHSFSSTSAISFRRATRYSRGVIPLIRLKSA